MFRITSSLCAALCFGLVIFHEVLGSPTVLPPLSAAGIPPDVTWLLHFSWHTNSISMLAMGVMFAHAAFHDCSKTLAAIATLMIVGYAVMALGLAFLGSSAMWETPAPYIWPAFALISGAGLLFTEPRFKR